MSRRSVLALPLAATLYRAAAAAQTKPSRDDVLAAMRKAAAYYREQVAVEGGYVYYYSPDLQRRWGEGPAAPRQIWVQPPGTPTVGMAYLAAYRASGDNFYLDAARDAGTALLYGQLASGGWTNCVDFDPRGPGVAQYRNGRGQGRNFSTLDDGISQAALQFLMQLDRALQFEDPAVRQGTQFALDSLLKAQFPNGGFPQGWVAAVEPQPIVPASFPDYDWREEGRIKNYWDMYTLNDELAGSVAETLRTAHAVYGEQRYRDALVGLGEFLLLAQLPPPQPAWAQQYNYRMQPIWARRFEPPAVTGGESQDVLHTLLVIHRETGDARWLKPVPAALQYLRRSLLADGRLARYYELRTNRPLYMTRSGDTYSLTYDDRNLPDHYGWKIESRLDALQAAYRRAAAGRPAAPADPPAANDVARLLADQDSQGRWISHYRGERLVGQPKFAPGEAYLSSAVFSDALTRLAQWAQQ